MVEAKTWGANFGEVNLRYADITGTPLWAEPLATWCPRPVSRLCNACGAPPRAERTLSLLRLNRNRENSRIRSSHLESHLLTPLRGGVWEMRFSGEVRLLVEEILGDSWRLVHACDYWLESRRGVREILSASPWILHVAVSRPNVSSRGDSVSLHRVAGPLPTRSIRPLLCSAVSQLPSVESWTARP